MPQDTSGEKVGIPIIFEDGSFIVIDKPSGVVVNKIAGWKEATIQDWAEAKIKNFSGGKREELAEFLSRTGLVHRLDRETSGLLVIAKTPAAFSNLKDQFVRRQVAKTYLALVHGVVTPPTGTVRVPVGRSSYHGKEFGVVTAGREAETDYQTTANYELRIPSALLRTSKNYRPEKLTLLEVMPKTGRTHQVRVHLRHLGHPVVADLLYVGRKLYKLGRTFCPRLFLHATQLEFSHPVTGKTLIFHSELPEDLRETLNHLETLEVRG